VLDSGTDCAGHEQSLGDCLAAAAQLTVCTQTVMLELCDDLLGRTRHCEAGLAALRDDHENILSHLKFKDKHSSEEVVTERVHEVAETLDRLELGLDESDLISSLAEHFDMLESDQAMSKLDVIRLKDENDWLREELEEAEKRLEDVLEKLAGLDEEKKHWLFMEEVRLSEQEADIRPVTPSKIPVGSFRVEEEKAINRALSSGAGPGSPERSVSPAPQSRIPKFSSGLPVTYRRVQDKIDKATTEKQEKRRVMSGKRHKLSKTPATSYSNIPALAQSSVLIPQGSRLLQPGYALQKCRSDPSIHRSRSTGRIAKFKTGADQF